MSEETGKYCEARLLLTGHSYCEARLLTGHSCGLATNAGGKFCPFHGGPGPGRGMSEEFTVTVEDWRYAIYNAVIATARSGGRGYETPPRVEPIATIAFRDAVIAGLTARGWPEPMIYSHQSLRWGPGDLLREVAVDAGEPEIMVDYQTDDGENGKIVLPIGTLPARVVEAIDRLRWVIGLPAADRSNTIVLTDEQAGLVPMTPAKPAPREDPAYVPSRWIDGE